MGNPVDLESKEPAVVVQNKNNDDPRRRQVVDLGEFLFHKFQQAVQYFVVKWRLIAWWKKCREERKFFFALIFYVALSLKT